MHVSFVIYNLLAALAIVAFTLWVFAAATFFSFLAALVLITLLWTVWILPTLVVSLATILVILWTILSALLLIFVTVSVIVIIHNIPFFLKNRLTLQISISYLEEHWVEFVF